MKPFKHHNMALQNYSNTNLYQCQFLSASYFKYRPTRTASKSCLKLINFKKFIFFFLLRRDYTIFADQITLSRLNAYRVLYVPVLWSTWWHASPSLLPNTSCRPPSRAFPARTCVSTSSDAARCVSRASMWVACANTPTRARQCCCARKRPRSRDSGRWRRRSQMTLGSKPGDGRAKWWEIEEEEEEEEEILR